MLVLYTRCQGTEIDNFGVSYSLDKGVTWVEECVLSKMYTTNTQATIFDMEVNGKTADLSLLVEPAELDLIRDLSRLPEEIRLAAEARDPSRLNRYAASVATAFHHFYTVCRIKEAATPELRDARIQLVHCVAQVIRNALSCLGVSAPDHM